MKLVLDSSILIDHLRGKDAAADLLTSAIADGDELWSVAVVRTEILSGLRHGEEQATARLLGKLSWVAVDNELADAAGELGRRHLRAYAGIDAVDLLIAAATQKLGAELKTLNVRHFPMFQGLRSAY